MTGKGKKQKENHVVVRLLVSQGRTCLGRNEEEEEPRRHFMDPLTVVGGEYKRVTVVRRSKVNPSRKGIVFQLPTHI